MKDSLWFDRVASLLGWGMLNVFVPMAWNFLISSSSSLRILKSLNSLEERLDQRTFFRANRKHIVNLRMIEKVEPFFNGGLLLEIKGGEKIEVSRRQAVRFKEMMSL